MKNVHPVIIPTRMRLDSVQSAGRRCPIRTSAQIRIQNQRIVQIRHRLTACRPGRGQILKIRRPTEDFRPITVRTAQGQMAMLNRRVSPVRKTMPQCRLHPFPVLPLLSPKSLALQGKSF